MDLIDLEYPRHLHKPVSRRDWDAGSRVSRVVSSADECQAAIEDGWQLQPVILDASDLVPEPPKRRGRPPKVRL